MGAGHFLATHVNDNQTTAHTSKIQRHAPTHTHIHTRTHTHTHTPGNSTFSPLGLSFSVKCYPHFLAHRSCLAAVHVAVWDDFGERDEPIVDLVPPSPFHCRQTDSKAVKHCFILENVYTYF